MIVRTLNPSQGSMSPGEALGDSDTLGIDRNVYRKLSSLTDMKEITTPTSADTEFHRFLLEMDKLQAGLDVDSPIEVLNEYLGTLGVTTTYPFPNDTYDVEEWIDVTAHSEYRNVSADSGDNVIADIDGVDYNVIN